jgi:hypothetical protein
MSLLLKSGGDAASLASLLAHSLLTRDAGVFIAASGFAQMVAWGVASVSGGQLPCSATLLRTYRHRDASAMT